MQRLLRLLVRPFVWWGERPAVSDPLEQTAWQRGKADMAASATAHPLWGLFVTAIPTAVGALALTDSWWRVPLAFVGAALGYCLVPFGWAAVAAIAAPYRQRDEARALLKETKDLHDLVELDRQLSAVSASNTRILQEVRDRGLTGPLDEDADPWIRSENENMERWLEGAGFSDLVPRIVLNQPSLSTWEEVKRAARKFSENVEGVLASDLLADVRHLRETGAPERDAAEPYPVVVFHEPATDDHVPLAGGGEAAYAFGRVENRKSHPPSGQLAQGARLTLEYFEFETDRPLFSGPFEGRWREATSPLELSPFQRHDHTIPLRANGTVYEFDLGRKSLGEGGWHAIDAVLALLPTGTKRARVVATIEGDNFDAVRTEFVVQSNGYKKGLTATLLGPDTEIEY